VSIVLDKVEKDKIKWKLSNSGGVGATIDTLIVSWPGDGELKKVKFDGSEILKDVLLASPAEITSDEWLKQPKDRTLDAGDSGKKLELEFDADFPLGKEQPPGDFELQIEFEQGCEVDANGDPKLLEGDAEGFVALESKITEGSGLGGCSAARAGREDPLGLLLFAGALLLWSKRRRRTVVACSD
jgi:MYXO-CTERM domain-containing protein